MVAATPATPARPSRHFRPRSSITAALALILVTFAWAWFAAADGGGPGLARQVPGIVLAATLGYAVLVRPAVVVGPAGVTLRGVVRDVEVPWAALAEVRTRFSLTLVTVDGARFAAWAAPASGRHTDTRLTRREVGAIGGDHDHGLPTASSSPASHSGAVAAWVRREWRRAIETDAAATPDGPRPAVRTRPARGVLATLAAAALLTLAARVT